MNETSLPFRTFEDLEVYRCARLFRKALYGVARRLPAFERNDLNPQIRRAAVSLTNNIAEGHGRFHYLDQVKFCLIARGSLEELLDDLNVCVDESYLSTDEVSSLKQQGWHVHRLLNGYINYLRTRKTGALTVQESAAGYGPTDSELDPEPIESREQVGPFNSSTVQPFNP